jgi:3'(2'), 5'-bisphosphate nucleotidase
MTSFEEPISIGLEPVLMRELQDTMLKAGTEIQNIFKSDGSKPIEFKGDNSPISKADLLAHELITERLAKLTPEIDVISEESYQPDAVIRNRPFWLLDPLDGTKEFLRGSHEFTINLALIVKNETRFGYVSVPAEQSLYWGGRGFGSYKLGIDLNIKRIHCQRSDSQLRVLITSSHMNQENNLFLNKIKYEKTVVPMGSSLKFIKIAEGRADLYPRIGPTKEWDTAAAHAVLEGAGGVVLDLNGKSLRYGKKNIENPHFLAMSDRAILASISH